MDVHRLVEVVAEEVHTVRAHAQGDEAAPPADVIAPGRPLVTLSGSLVYWRDVEPACPHPGALAGTNSPVLGVA